MFKQWFKPKSTTPVDTASSPETKMAQALQQTQKGLMGQMFGLFRPKSSGSVAETLEASRIDEPFEEGVLEESQIDEIEELLIRADTGLSTALDLTEALRKERLRIKTPRQLNDFLREQFKQILKPQEAHQSLSFQSGVMNIYLVVGVNGAGKTTLIGKLAHQFVQQGQQVIIGAGDTFRAAAEEQLEIWAKRAGAKLVSSPNGDPAAVIFDTLVQAKASNAQVVLLDTAGRLQNKFNLMEELRKIYKVIQKEAPENASLESLLVIDATTGQNALKQAEVFHEAVQLTGVALTKLDGSAKGGIVLAIAKEFELPVKLVGVGEKIEDLQPFSADAFLNGLFGEALYV